MKNTILLTAFLLAIGLACILVAVQAGNAQADTIYIDSTATPGGDGTAWATAFTDLQDALDDVVNVGTPCEIWVAAGTYTPTAEHGGTGPRYSSFQMMNDVGIYGGFAGGETARSQRNWQTNATILNGDSGIPGYPLDDCYHVFYHPSGLDLNETAILDGFIITGGNADGPSDIHQEGGGMYNSSSSPTLTNCTFSSNTANSNGGGICNSSSSPTLTSCAFFDNTADWSGSGIYNSSSSSPILTDCNFSGNISNVHGGGICNYSYSSPTLTDCTFSGNTANDYGGGIYNSSSSSPTLTDCTFSGNTSNYGGGIYNYSSSSPTLTDCTFSGNTANSSGGGILNASSSSPTLTDCTFSGNTANYGGGIYNNDSSSPTLAECTLSGNTANSNGGGIYNELSSAPIITNTVFDSNTASQLGGGMYSHSGCLPVMTNCTLWNNSASQGGTLYNSFYSSPTVINSVLREGTPQEIYNIDSSTPVITYSNVQGGYTGKGNITGVPMFANPGSGDFHLQLTSPCIDTGTNSAPNLPAQDFWGDPRVMDGVADMGVDEFTGSIPQYNLTISSTLRGFVTTPGEGTMGPYNEGMVVNLVAEALPGSTFSSWTGDTSTIANTGDPTTTIVMNGSYSITANFEGTPPAGLATRTLPTSVAPGTECEVSISAAGCGMMGEIIEIIPAGFTYLGMDDAGDFDITVTGQKLRIIFIGNTVEITYQVQAPVIEGEYAFYGTATGDDLVAHSIGGDVAIDVGEQAWSPWDYDLDDDGIISKQEALNAVVEFFDQIITKQQALQVIVIFFD